MSERSYRLRIIFEQGTTTIEVRDVGEDKTVLALDAPSARDLATLLVAVADTADRMRPMID